MSARLYPRPRQFNFSQTRQSQRLDACKGAIPCDITCNRCKTCRRAMYSSITLEGVTIQPELLTSNKISRHQSPITDTAHCAMFNPYVQTRSPCSKVRCEPNLLRIQLNHLSISLAVSQVLQHCGRASEHSGLCSVWLPTLAAEEEYWSTLIANHAQTMGIQRMRLGQRKEAQRWTVI
jgi:hypothetical protein